MSKLFRKPLSALAVSAALVCSFNTLAETLAITNAKVHTASDAGVLEGATVFIRDGKIEAINPASFEADSVVDAQGKVLTPGFITAGTSLGLVEVGAVARTRDGGDKKADITFDPSLAFNFNSTLIPYVRQGGVTQSIVVPSGGDDIFAGQNFVANLSGNMDSVEQVGNSVLVSLGAESKGSRAMSLQKLAKKLETTAKDIAKAKGGKDDKESSKELGKEDQLLRAVVTGEIPLIANVDRASDILAILKLKQQYELNLVLAGAADAIVVKSQIAQAGVPVIIDAIDNLPSGFDSLHLTLENAAQLEKAGIKLLINIFDSHNGYQLRFNAGIAVAYGMSYDGALKAITSNVATTFGLPSGEIATGKSANLVLWNSDPFELNSKVEKLWINGEAVNLETRQDKLRDRYLKKSDMPPAYHK